MQLTKRASQELIRGVGQASNGTVSGQNVLAFDSRPGLLNSGARCWIVVGMFAVASGVMAAEAAGAADRSLEDIIRQLTSSNAEERYRATKAAAEFGVAAAAAVPELRVAVTDTDFLVREGAVDALGKVGPAGIAAVRELIPCLGHSVPLHDAAARTLVRLGPAVVPFLLQAPVDAHAKELAQGELAAWDAMHATEGSVQPVVNELGSAAVPGLIGGLVDKDDVVREVAVDLLGGMAQDASPAIPLMARLVTDADVDVRIATVRALGRLGPTARQVIPALRKMTNDRELGVEVRRALETIEARAR